AVNDNPQLKTCEIKKSNYEIQLDAAEYSAATYRKTRTVLVSSGYEVTYVKGGYYVLSAQEAIKLSDMEYEQVKSKIAYDTTEKYFNYKSAVKLVELMNKSYELIENNYNSAKLSYDLGLISKSELDNAALSVKQALYTLESYKDNCELAKENLKIILQKNNEDCELILTDEISSGEYDFNLENDLVTASEKRYDINSLKSNYILAEKYYDLTDLPENSAKYYSAMSNYITAKYNYTRNKDLILLGVRSTYNNISAAKNNLDLKIDTLSIKNDNYSIANVKYEQGMITNIELTSALNDAAQAEIDVENAKLAYKLALEKYHYEVVIGL
ncbi:MAG: TolC family protein, partial [Clostridia bacterium]|nr:TolC family protein [Clostridia bacterium]